MATVICGIDDSARARRGLLTAAALAHRLGAELIAVHVIDVHPPALQSPEEDLELLAPGGELLARITSETGVRPARSLIETGAPAETLRAVADAERAELIVVGSRGRGRLGTALLGSAATALGASAPCPVVVVPARAHIPEEQAACVIAGVDGSDEALAAARVAAALSERFDSRLLLAHVQPDLEKKQHGLASGPATLNEDQHDSEVEPAQELLDRTIDEVGGLSEAQTSVASGPPAEALEAVADREGAAVIVVGSRGQGRVRAALLGSVSAELASSSSRPVVIVSKQAQGFPADRGCTSA